MSTDMATMTGAYVLHGLSETERAAFERHLVECADCAIEVQELRETAAYLGRTTATHPPEALKDRVLEEITRTRQEHPHPPARSRNERGRRARKARQVRAPWTTRLAVAAAALGIALASAFGAVAWQSRQELAEQRRGEVVMSELFRAPDARIAMVRESGMQAVTVMSDRMDRAMFLGSSIERPPADKTYQLWFIGPYGFSSAGLVEQGTDGEMQPIIAAVPEGTKALGLTLEPAGGSPQPTTDPVLTMSMTA